MSSVKNVSSSAGWAADVPFMIRLREATRPEHSALEKLPLSRALMNPSVTREEYGRYMQSMFPIVSIVEDKIYPVLSNIFPDLDKRSKLPHLTDDLTFLQLPVNQPGLLITHESLITTSIPHAIGIVYVLEGSTLGGRIIVKNITSALGFDKNHGASYFTGYGEQTGPLWKSFLNSLTQYEITSGNGEAIMEGARQAFQAIHDQISRAYQM